MSVTKQRHEAERWLTTAREDLDAAETLLGAAHFAQSCFLSQQAAEKAVKAAWHVIDTEPWGHSIQKLVTDYPLPDRLGDLADLRQRAIELDRLYIPTRYPNGIPDLTPGQAYTETDASQALAHSRHFIALATSIVRTPEPRTQ